MSQNPDENLTHILQGELEQPHPGIFAAGVAGIYLAAGWVYIYLSGVFAADTAGSVEQLKHIELIKGSLFVLCSAVGLFVVLWLLLMKIKRKQDQLVQYREQVLESNRQAMTGLFASSIAHDINNILATMEFAAEELKDTQDEEVKGIAEGIGCATRDLMKLSRSLSMVAGRHLTDTVESFDLVESIQEVVTLARLHRKVRGCEIKLEVPDCCRIEGRRVMFHQMLLNLLINAGDATGNEGTILVRLSCSGRKVQLEVHDNGGGIPEELKERILEPMFTTKKSGTGLGLLSMRVFADEHKGGHEILDSKLGGALIRVSLPNALQEAVA